MPYQVDRPTDEIAETIEFCDREFDVYITRKQAVLINLLKGCAGRIARKDYLVDELWPDDLNGFDHDRYNELAVFVYDLRKKLGKNLELKTVYGVGYQLKRLGNQIFGP